EDHSVIMKQVIQCAIYDYEEFDELSHELVKYHRKDIVCRLLDAYQPNTPSSQWRVLWDYYETISTCILLEWWDVLESIKQKRPHRYKEVMEMFTFSLG